MAIIRNQYRRKQKTYDCVYLLVFILLINQVGNSQEVKPAVGLKVTKIKVESGQKYKMGVTPLQNQARIYVDRDHLKFTNVPKPLSGLHYIMTANADHKGKGEKFLTFVVNQTDRLWVARDSRGAPEKKGVVPKWLLTNFHQTKLQIKTNEPKMESFVIYKGKADLAKGKHSLGGNADPPAQGQMNNYVLIFGAGEGIEKEPEMTVPKGDNLPILWSRIKISRQQ